MDGPAAAVERVARQSYGKLVAMLTRRTRDIAAAEDALSGALVKALEDWPRSGVPGNPEGWLVAAARRLAADAWRRGETARAGREMIAMLDAERAAVPGDEHHAPEDARLTLMFACAHPAIDPAIHAPLMLQAVLGLDAARIAGCLLVKPATLGQRLARAKARLKEAGARFALPDAADLQERRDAVLAATYAAYTLGWDGAFGGDAHIAGLSGEAVWLARVAAEAMPGEAEATALLSLMLFSESRRSARRADGVFVPLSEQDMSLWDEALCAEAEGLLRLAAPTRASVQPHASPPRSFGRYALEAAIRAVHADRRRSGRTDWAALEHLYRGLLAVSPAIGARIAHALALAEVNGVSAGLDALAVLPADRVAEHQPYWAARAHLVAKAGLTDEALAAYARAIGLCADEAARRHLTARRAALLDG
jgi:RNA polymerase sigma-70 factor (ECF subfamily)